jgi:threonine synthase
MRRYAAGDASGQTRGTTYELCPHTAVGVVAAERLWGARAAAAPAATHGPVVTVCLGTAHPAKFPDAFRAATGRAPTTPAAIAALAGLPTRCVSLPAVSADALRTLVKQVAPRP